MSNKPKGTKEMQAAFEQSEYIKTMQDRLKTLRLEHELAKLTVEKLQYEEWLMKKFPQEPVKESGDNLKNESESQDIPLKNDQNDENDSGIQVEETKI